MKDEVVVNLTPAFDKEWVHQEVKVVEPLDICGILTASRINDTNLRRRCDHDYKFALHYIKLHNLVSLLDYTQLESLAKLVEDRMSELQEENSHATRS